MADRRHAKLGIVGLVDAQRDEMAHWRAPKLRTTTHVGAERRSQRPQKRWNWGLLAALLLNALLWAGIYWVVAALL